MGNTESLPAQYQAPFRVDPTGFARKAEQEARKSGESRFDCFIVAVGATAIEAPAPELVLFFLVYCIQYIF